MGLGSDDDDGNAASSTDKHKDAPQEDMGTFEDTIVDVLQKPQKGPKGDFTVFTVKVGCGEHLQTLDRDLALKAKGYKGTGETVILDTEPSKYGPKLLTLSPKE